jgi:hypothetical protein
MNKKKVLFVALMTFVMAQAPINLQAQIWNDLWDTVASAFDDVEKQSKAMLKQTVDVGGKTIDLGSNAVGAATEAALNAKTATYGAVKSVNSKAFIYFKEAVPIPGMWDAVQKVTQNTFDNYDRLEQSAQASQVYGSAVCKRILTAALSGDWKSIWDFANGMTGYLTIQPSQNCPRPLATAIFIFNPVTKKFRAVSINPNLKNGNLSYVYAAPHIDLNYDRGTNPDEVSPVDLFIGAVGIADPKTKTVKWDYSGPCSVLQKSKWLVDYNNGEFVSKLVADDGNIDNKPERSNGIVPKPDVPSSVNADMNNSSVPYCRTMDGVYSIPVNKGQIIRFGDIITLESVQYNYYLDADDDMCRPLGILPGNDKQWIIVDPLDQKNYSVGKPVPQQYKIALRSVSKDRYLDADDACVTAGGSGFGDDKLWWFAQPVGGDQYVKSGHVLGLKNLWKNRFLDADDNRCTADGNSIDGWDKQWRVELLSADPVPYGQEPGHPDRHTINVHNDNNESWIVDLTLRPYAPFTRPFYDETEPRMSWPLPSSPFAATLVGNETVVNYFPVIREYSRWAKEMAPQEIGGISCYGVPRGEKNKMYVHISAWRKSTGKLVWDVFFDEAAGDHIDIGLDGNGIRSYFNCGNIHYWTDQTGK